MKHKALSIAILSLHCGLMANPTNPQVSNGDVSFDASTPGVLNIQADDRSIINWQDFSIQAGEITQFIQPDSSSAVLNRVMGGNCSSIMGSLQANGKVYLINPSGVIFGKDSVIDTGALLASTLDLPDQLFLQDGDLLFSGDSNAALVNFGAIQASNGDVILIGYQIENNGTIDAPNGVAAIAAGREVLIRPLAEERIYIRLKAAQEDISGVGIDNAGDISALQAELKADGNSFAKAINHSGSIEATGIVDQGGRVYLVSSNGNMEISGFIAAQDGQGNGGGVDLLAQNIAMSPDGVVNVDGGSSGNGGTVLFFADHAAIFYGTISAEGGEMGGDGGFVEVSGPSLDFSGMVSTYAPEGKTGTLLLDPNYITISNAPTTIGTKFVSETREFPPPPREIMVYNGLQNVPHPTSSSNLNVGLLVSTLTSNNVKIETCHASSVSVGSGNIDFLDPVIWTSNTSFEVFAYNKLNFTQSIINMGTGDMTFATINGDINVGNPMVGVQIGSVGGDRTPTVTIDAANDLNILPGSKPGAFAQVGLDASHDVPEIKCDIIVNVAGQLHLQKGTADGCYAAIGHGGASGEATLLKGNILLLVGTSTEKQRGIILDGGSGTGCHAIIGHFAETSAPVTINGNLSFHPYQSITKRPTNLTAGTGINSFALIGHGGNKVAAGSRILGNVDFSSDGDITLTGGNAPMGQGQGAFAAIGITNGGNSDLGNVTVSGSIFVNNPAHAISLTAGNQLGNNASIGILFNNIDLAKPNSITGDIRILGKDLTVAGSAGSSDAFAIIGATSDPAGTGMGPMNVISSNVNITVKNLDLVGGLNPFGQGGLAKILNGDSTNVTSDIVSIIARDFANITGGRGETAEVTLFSTGTLAFDGGETKFLTPGFNGNAKARSNGAITFTTSNLTLNSNTSNADAGIVSNFGNATVNATGNITMNTRSFIIGIETVTVNAAGGDLTILGMGGEDIVILNIGGANTTLKAGRNINIQQTRILTRGSGTFTLDAGNDIVIGNVSNMFSTEVSQSQGKISVSAGGNLQVIGGNSVSSILGPNGFNLGVDLDITKVGGNVSVFGGSAGSSFAQIGANSGFGEVTGNITFSNVSGNVILKAGTGSFSFAQIGSQGNNVNSTVKFSNVNGNVTLTPGGVATNAFAQIGSRYNSGSPGAPELSVKGSISPSFFTGCGTPYAVIDNVQCGPVP